MEPRMLDLGGDDWRMGWVPPQPFRSAQPYDAGEVKDWYPARVPGNVRTDLLAAKMIPDPMVGEQWRLSLWTEDVDWWYRRQLSVDLEKDGRAFLICEGIDYLSAVWLGERRLGTHEGMFSQQIYEVTGPLRSGASELAIRIWGSHALPPYPLTGLDRALRRLMPRTVGGLEMYPDRMATTKCQMSFGWDFAPAIRTMGIWDAISLKVSGPVALLDAWVHAWPLTDAQDPTPARLRVVVTIDADRPLKAELVLSIAGPDGERLARQTFPCRLRPGRQAVELELGVEAAPRWWPWDHGHPQCLEAHLALYVEGHGLSDQLSVPFGVRSVAWLPTRGQPAGRWALHINGVPVFMRGANWVPPDVFPGRVREADYRELLQMARDAGINLLRVWGGGLREKRAFYDACNRLGILVWQEFPLACAFFDRFPRDQRYLAQLEREARAIVRALRSHPSLILWCGGNEFSPRRNRPAVDRVARAVAEEDGTRRFIPASPGPGEVHRWDVWHGRFPIETYLSDEHPMVGEFGVQAAPGIETLRRALGDAHLWPPDRMWEVHHAQLEKLYYYARPFWEGDDLASFIEATQDAQCWALQIMIEHVRRRRGRTAGCAFWQFNEPWPAISWAVVAWDRMPKRAYERLRCMYQPLLISLRWPVDGSDRVEVWAVNDTGLSYEGCRWVVRSGDGHVLAEGEGDVPPYDAVIVGIASARWPQDVEVSLWSGDHCLARNRYRRPLRRSPEPGWLQKAVTGLAARLLE